MEVSTCHQMLDGGRSRDEGQPLFTRKVHQCTLCSFSAYTPSGLKEHFRTHTGEKPFACPHCSYKSNKKFNLKLHLRIHTGEKPFSCPFCTYQSSNSSHVNRHIRTHIDWRTSGQLNVWLFSRIWWARNKSQTLFERKKYLWKALLALAIIEVLCIYFYISTSWN